MSACFGVKSASLCGVSGSTDIPAGIPSQLNTQFWKRPFISGGWPPQFDGEVADAFATVHHGWMMASVDTHRYNGGTAISAGAFGANSRSVTVALRKKNEPVSLPDHVAALPAQPTPVQPKPSITGALGPLTHGWATLPNCS